MRDRSAQMPVSDRLCAQCQQKPAFHIVRRRSRVTGKVRFVHLCDECVDEKRTKWEPHVETLDRPARPTGVYPDLDEIERNLK